MQAIMPFSSALAATWWPAKSRYAQVFSAAFSPRYASDTLRDDRYQR